MGEGGEGGTLQTDATQFYLFVPIPATAKKLGLLSIYKFSLSKGEDSIRAGIGYDIRLDSLSVSGPENVIYSGTALPRQNVRACLFKVLCWPMGAPPPPILSLSLLYIFGALIKTNFFLIYKGRLRSHI